MPSPLILASALVAVVVLAAVTLGPAYWLTRSAAAVRLRYMRGRSIAGLWIICAVPWAAALTYIHFTRMLSVSAHSPFVLVLLILAALLVIAALVSLPITVAVLSIVWWLDRRVLE